MCSKRKRSALLRIIEGANDRLTVARNHLMDVPRPSNTCDAHDDIFLTSQAQSEALLALLACEQSRLENPEIEVNTKLGLIVRCRWPLAIVCFSPFAGNIIEKVLHFFGN